MKLELHPLSLKFAGAGKHLEEAYCQDSFNKNISYLRVCHILSLVAFSSAGIIDYIAFPEDFTLAWTIRYGTAPFFLAGLALSYTPVYRQYWQLMAFLYVLATGLASLAILCLMPPPVSYLYFVHIGICYMFGFIFVRARFLVASLAGVILFSALMLTMLLLEHPPQAVMYNATITMLIMLLMGMYFAYGYEYTDRRDFFLRVVVEGEREKTAILNQTLENRVRKRTVELEKEMASHLRSERGKKDLERRLDQSQRMEAIGTLAGGIAHDFNNILTSVIGYSELAKMECGDQQRLQDYLEQVLIAAKRASELVRQILTFSRQTEQESRPVQLTAVAAEVIKLIRASLPSTITITSRIEENLAVLADQTQLHQVLMNLCTNASHAMQQQGGILEIELEKIRLPEQKQVGDQVIGAGIWVRLTVRDSGCGISEAVIGRIFEPFFTTKGASEGTGMGLAVVHGIIIGHRGAIAVESVLGEGTCFEVYLPAIDLATSTPGGNEQKMVGGSEHILVVDDEVPLVEILTDVLTRLGYTVAGRTSSLEALELFKAAPDRFDLVITDLTMPNLCGDHLAREITRLRPVPVLLCTGFSVGTARESYAEYGVADVLEKPIPPRQLAERVRQVLDRKGGGEG